MIAYDIIDALTGHTGLRNLSLSGVEMSRMDCVALTTLFQNPRSNLTALRLSCTGIGDEEAKLFASCLSGCSKINEIELSGAGDISNIGWQSFFGELFPLPTLEKLDLHSNNLNDSIVGTIANALFLNTTLKTLDLSCIEYNDDYADNDSEDDDQRADIAHDSDSDDRRADIVHDSDDEDRRANIAHERGIGAGVGTHRPPVTITGWRSLFHLLRGSNSALEVLNLSFNSITDEAVDALRNGLTINSRLQELVLIVTNRMGGFVHCFTQS